MVQEEEKKHGMVRREAGVVEGIERARNDKKSGRKGGG